MLVSRLVEEPQTPQVGVSPGWQASSPSSTTPMSTTAATVTAAWNTTGKSSVLRFYLHKMIGLTTSRSKCRPRWFSLRILSCSDTHTHIFRRSVAFRFRGNNTATTIIKSNANGRAHAKKSPTRIFLSRRIAQSSGIANSKDRKRNVIANWGKEKSNVWEDAKYKQKSSRCKSCLYYNSMLTRIVYES